MITVCETNGRPYELKVDGLTASEIFKKIRADGVILLNGYSRRVANVYHTNNGIQIEIYSQRSANSYGFVSF